MASLGGGGIPLNILSKHRPFFGFGTIKYSQWFVQFLVCAVRAMFNVLPRPIQWFWVWCKQWFCQELSGDFYERVFVSPPRHARQMYASSNVPLIPDKSTKSFLKDQHHWPTFARCSHILRVGVHYLALIFDTLATHQHAHSSKY